MWSDWRHRKDIHRLFDIFESKKKNISYFIKQMIFYKCLSGVIRFKASIHLLRELLVPKIVHVKYVLYWRILVLASTLEDCLWNIFFSISITDLENADIKNFMFPSTIMYLDLDSI